MSNIKMLIDATSHNLTEKRNVKNAFFKLGTLSVPIVNFDFVPTLLIITFQYDLWRANRNLSFLKLDFFLTDIPAKFQKAKTFLAIGLQKQICFLMT